MSSAAPPPTAPLLTTPLSVITTLTSFLTVLTHHILYLRALYPRLSFLSARAYNFPVRQSRHPGVCTWVLDAVSAVQTQLLRSAVARISVVVFSVATNEPLERYTVDVSQLPIVPEREVQTEWEVEPDAAAGGAGGVVRVADLEAQFRAILARLNTACGRLAPLPQGEECSFTLCIELREQAGAPAGVTRSEQAWIPAEPERKDNQEEVGGEEKGKRKKEGRTTPVRRVEAGELRMEVWIEESKAKFASRNGSQSFGDPP